jgi:hypothetical protein
VNKFNAFKTTIMMIALILIALLAIIMLLISKQISNGRNFLQYFYQYTNIFTSKWIGLTIFTISNIITGLLNTIVGRGCGGQFKLSDINEEKSVFIISSYLFFVYCFAYLVYIKLNLRNDLRHKNQNNNWLNKTLKII